MIFYQILSAFCFSTFIVNIAFIVYLRFYYDVPAQLYRYMFLSLIKNIIGAATQLYIAQCDLAWYLKSFPFIVCLSSFTWCLDTYKTSHRIKSKNK